MKKGVRRADIALIGGLLLVCAALFAIMQLKKSDGAQLIVRVDGEITARYSLSDDGVYPLNGGTNTLVVSGGEAYLSDADCPDKLCVLQGKIRYMGQCITCLPNKLTVTVSGGEKQVDLYS